MFIHFKGSFIVLFILSFFVCENIYAQQSKKKPVKKKVSKHQKKSKAAPVIPTYTLSGRIEIVEDICNEEKQKIGESNPKPCLDKYFFIKKGNSNSAKNPVIDVIKVDEQGNFNLRLKQGNYCIIQSFQTKPLQLENYQSTKDFEYLGEDCLRQFWADCYKFVELNQDINDLIIKVSTTCYGENNPCLKYDVTKTLTK